MGLTLCILCLLNFRSVTANWVGQSCLVLSAEETGTLLDWVLWEGDSLLLQICSVHGDPFRQSESSFKSWYKSSSPPTQTKSCAKWGVGIVFRFAQLFIKKKKKIYENSFLDLPYKKASEKYSSPGTLACRRASAGHQHHSLTASSCHQPQLPPRGVTAQPLPPTCYKGLGDKLHQSLE